MPRTVDSPIYQKAQILDALRDTGALIAEARKARGWSQTDLGARLGTCVCAICFQKSSRGLTWRTPT